MAGEHISGHIPDFDLITYYSEKVDSFFSRVSPWTRAIMLVIIVLFVTVVRNIVFIFALYLAVLAVYWMAKLPMKKLFEWYTFPVVFVLSLVIILMWNEPGTVIWSFRAFGYALTLTDNGLLLVVSLLLKALISVTYSLFFLMTTKYNHLSAMIYRVFPSPIDQIFLMSYRFLFITLKMIDSMMKSLRSRGSGLISSMRRQSAMFAEVFALVFIRSFDRAERINKAMESRGFSGKYVAATKVPGIGPIDFIFMIAATAVTIYLSLPVYMPF